MTDPRDLPGTWADAVARMARELRGSVPAPRGAPYFGLDMRIDFDPAVLESLSDPGIFRKYELVLLLGNDCGGVARWLATRLGCRIVSVETDFELQRRARDLNGRVHLDHQVQFVAAGSRALPFRDRSFTHAWILRRAEEIDRRTMAAAFHALRPGGHVAIQLPEPTLDRERERLTRDLGATGFGGVAVREVAWIELPSTYRAARDRCGLMTRDGEGAKLLQVYATRPS